MMYWQYLPDDNEYHVWSDGWDLDEYEVLTPTEFAAVSKVLSHHNGLEEYKPATAS